MINSVRKTILTGMFFIIIFSILMMSLSCWGSPTFDFSIENRTDKNLIIFVNDFRVGEVGPVGQLTREDETRNTGKYLIEVKSPLGDLIYSKELNYQQLQDADFRVIIPDSLINP
jgi:hypothetical protein